MISLVLSSMQAANLEGQWSLIAFHSIPAFPAVPTAYSFTMPEARKPPKTQKCDKCGGPDQTCKNTGMLKMDLKHFFVIQRVGAPSTVQKQHRRKTINVQCLLTGKVLSAHDFELNLNQRGNSSVDNFHFIDADSLWAEPAVFWLAGFHSNLSWALTWFVNLINWNFRPLGTLQQSATDLLPYLWDMKA